jgi:hypothetical protein
MTGGTGNDLFRIDDAGSKMILDFNLVAGENDRINLSAFLKDLDQVINASELVQVGGVESTRITYADAKGDQTTLTLKGYNYQTDAGFPDHFIV